MDAKPRTRPLRIGCASGFWGDSEAGAAQLVRHGDIDVLVSDYLAEITMSLLARARAKDPAAGYATDFVRTTAALGPEIAARGVRVITNAGGVNPQACAEALRAAFAAQGVQLKIAVVEGDDLSEQAEALRAEGIAEMFSGAPMPAKLLSINAYLGGQPIAAALAAGPTWSSPAASSTVRSRWRRWCMPSAGAGTTGTVWRWAAWRATSSNAARSAPAACSPTGSRCRAGTTWVSPSSNATPMAAASCSPSRPARAGW